MKTSTPTEPEIKGSQLDVITVLRERVDAWRGYALDHPREATLAEGHYVPVAQGEHELTATTMSLLQHWFRPEPHIVPGVAGVQYFKYWPHQRRAVETFVYVHEVCRIRRTEDLWRLGETEPDFTQHDPWAKLGAQLATGAGKTKVMSLVAAWAILNAQREPKNTLGLGRHVLIVAPGLFVRDRLLQDFRPEKGQARSVFALDPVIPPSMGTHHTFNVYSPADCPRRLDPTEAAIVVTNFQQLLRVSEPPTARGKRSQLAMLFEEGNPSRLEDVGVPLIERFGYSTGVTVINDEAHHVWDEPGHQWFAERAARDPNGKNSEDEEQARAWIASLRRLHGTTGRTGRLGLQVDLSATLFEEPGAAKKTTKVGGRDDVKFRPAGLFRHTTVSYELRDAVKEGIVKRPVLEGITARNKKTNQPEPLINDNAPNAWAKYCNLIVPGIKRWEALCALAKSEGGRQPTLFILCDDRHQATEVANFLRYGDPSREDLAGQPVTGYTPEGAKDPLFVAIGSDGVPISTVVEVHIGKKEQSSEKEWEKIRERVNLIDRDMIPSGELNFDGNPVMIPNIYNVVVSVMMLKEGWDVRNVQVIVPLRACTSRTLTEQVLGRGLRRIKPPVVHEDGTATMGPRTIDKDGVEVDRPERLYVMEHPSFKLIIDQIKDLVDREESEHISHTPEYTSVSVKDDNAVVAEHDVRLATYGGQVEIVKDWRESFDVREVPAVSPRRVWSEEFDETEFVTHVREIALHGEHGGPDEGQTFTLPKLPSYRDFDHLVGVVYVRPLLQRLRKGHQQWNEVRGVVKDYLERRVFNFPASLPLSFDRALEEGTGRVAMANLARPEVSQPSIEALLPALSEAMNRRVKSTRHFVDVRLASDVKPYQAMRTRSMHEPLRRSVFDRAVMENGDELRVAILLDRCADVSGWMYNHPKVGYSIEYEWLGRVARYIPDFIVRASIDGTEHNFILEVKGRFDDRDRAKALRGVSYVRQLTIGDERPWHYILLLENPSNRRLDVTWWEKLSVHTIKDLLLRHENLSLFPERRSPATETAIVPSVAKDEEYRAALPVFDLAAGGAFSEPWAQEPVGWMRITPDPIFDRNCFIVRMSGTSMQPNLLDGAWVMFRRWDSASTSRMFDGRRVLVELRQMNDAETGSRYSVKRLKVVSSGTDGQRFELRSDNQAIAPVSLVDSEFRVIAEVVRVVD